MVMLATEMETATAAYITTMMIISTMTALAKVKAMNTVMVVDDRKRREVTKRMFDRWMYASILENNTEYICGSRTKFISYMVSRK